ncbi:MAG: hypothetical protein BHV91_03440 [Clostridiales bacterium 44_9]|nr:MAG: hypothetical protein BHV91_03440 [Clostridiales bacterium 44_9]
MIITEDSNSGYQFFSELAKAQKITCISADGKSNIIQKLRAQSAICFATTGEKSNIRVTMTLTRKGWSGTIYYPQTGA